jgi:hypothetical protein
MIKYWAFYSPSRLSRIYEIPTSTKRRIELASKLWGHLGAQL